MESRVGLDYIVEHAEYAAKLAAALSSPAAPVKKQVTYLSILYTRLLIYCPDPTIYNVIISNPRAERVTDALR